MTKLNPHNEDSYTERIYTKSGFVKVNPFNGLRTLDLGCGGRKLPGSVGVDSLALPDVDIVHDLDQYPWPFEDQSFDLIFANHYLEHATDVLKSMGEIHRILAPSGRVVIQVPYFRSTDASTDPTHKHFFTSSTLDYVIEGTGLANYQYTRFTFKRLGFWYAWPQESRNPITRWFKKYITKHSHWYDQFASLFLPVECITWELVKI